MRAIPSFHFTSATEIKKLGRATPSPTTHHRLRRSSSLDRRFLSLSPAAMSLQFSLSAPPALRSCPSPSPSSSSSCWPLRSAFDTSRRTSGAVSMAARDGGRRARAVAVRSSLETARAVVGQVTEVSKDTFWPIVKDAGSKIVVVDMYTQWCGPCKVIAPKYKELSEKYLDVVFLKLDCNQENKPLAKELGIKVVPTFKILKDSNVVKEVTGAKFDDLVLAIETVKSS